MGKKFFRVNHNIKSSEILLIDEMGNKGGVVPLHEALKRAEAAELDLVEVSPNAQPPVCKIIDFGKFKYELEKQERKQKAKNKGSDLKEIRLSLNINDNDLQVKRRKALEFLAKKHKVKLNIRLKGREMAYGDKAREMINKFFQSLEGKAKIEQEMKRLGAQIQIVLAPETSTPKPQKVEDKTVAVKEVLLDEMEKDPDDDLL